MKYLIFIAGLVLSLGVWTAWGDGTPLVPATGPQVLAGTSTYTAITPAALAAAGVVVSNGNVFVTANGVGLTNLNNLHAATTNVVITSSAGVPLLSQTNENLFMQLPYQDGQNYSVPMIFDMWDQIGIDTESYVLNDLTNLYNAGLTNYCKEVWYVIDDGWHTNIPPGWNTNLFPDGMKYVNDIGHTFGIKMLGYLEPGPVLSAGDTPLYPDAERRAQFFVTNDFDGVKLDAAGWTPSTAAGVTNFQKYSSALHRYNTNSEVCMTGFFPQLNPVDNSALFGLPQNTALWFGGDWDSESQIYGGYTNSFYTNAFIQFQQPFRNPTLFQRPGRWGGLYYSPANSAINSVSTAIIGTYAIFHYPIGATAVQLISPQQWQNITNSEIIAVDQDQSGIAVKFIQQTTTNFVAEHFMVDGSVAISCFNGQTNLPSQFTITLSTLGFNQGEVVRVRDLWAHQELGLYTNTFSTTVVGMSAQILRLWPLPVATYANNLIVAAPISVGGLQSSGFTSTELGKNPINAGLWLDAMADATNTGTINSRTPYAQVGSYASVVGIWTNSAYGPGIFLNNQTAGQGLDFGTNITGWNTNAFTFDVVAALNANSFGLTFGFDTNNAEITALNINNNGNIYWYVNNSAVAQSPTNLLDSTRHEITGTYNGSVANLFVDGQPVSSASASGGIVPYNTNHIVCESAGAAVQLLRIFNRALTTNEVAQLFAQSYAGNGFTASGAICAPMFRLLTNYNAALFAPPPAGYCNLVNSNNVLFVVSATVTNPVVRIGP